MNFGVPQKRKRLIIIAVSGEALIPPIPIPDKPEKTIGEALRGCPKSPGASYSEAKRRVMEMVPPGGCWTALPDEVQKEYMGASYGRASNQGGRRGMARRMSWDEPSLTILCSPSQKQTDRCHPSETRPFTIRESARLQSFPRFMEICRQHRLSVQAIGNAVPAKLAEAIANHVLKLYQENFYASAHAAEYSERTETACCVV